MQQAGGDSAQLQQSINDSIQRLPQVQGAAGDLHVSPELGKLDPVIGRDSEIRRTIQVLQHRTKNNPVLICEPVEQLTQRLNAQDIQLNVTDEALDKLATAGFDPVYDARPLKRAIQQYVENSLAENLLAGKFSANETITIALHEGSIVFISG